MALLAESNNLLATIPDYQMTMPVTDVEYSKILITDKGYILRLNLEYGEIYDVFLGKTREEAIKGLAHERIETYTDITPPDVYYPNEKDLSPFDKIKRFRAYCDSYIYKK